MDGRITLTMLSDWHVGTGSGIPGSVDALLAKDNEGFPQIPAKSVTGIWRDALEILTLGLDNGGTKNWQNWVDVIFGSQPVIDKNPNLTPRPAIISIQTAKIDETLRRAVGDKLPLKQALTFIKPNTKIDSKSGTAQTSSLRFTETGRIGSVLDAEFTLDCENYDTDQTELIKALLSASAKLIERIGGNRRRGSGRCEAEVSGLVSVDDAIEILRNYDVAKLGEVSKVKEKAEMEIPEKADSNNWKRIGFSLTLHTPVAIVTNTLGNVSETLDYIPGTYLLPHLSKQLPGISKYIASGDFQVLPATIEIDGKRGLPVPKVIYHHKVNGGFDKPKTVYNRLEEDIEVGEQKKNYREGYINSLDGEKEILPHYSTTRKVLLMHNTVEDQYQRPTEEVGGVFSRQAIQAGQVLKGEIRFKCSIESEVKSLEEQESYVRLGTSKKDDYGLAELKIEKIEPATSTATATKKLIVYLASDVLLRNPNMRQTNLAEDLKKLLEKELLTDLKYCEKKSLIQVRRIESWHTGWGFPRPTLTAMQAGSVIVFEVAGADINDADLQNLEHSGIGERRGEGYGQIKFNPAILMSKINDWKVWKKNDSETDNSEEKDEAIKELEKQLEIKKDLKKFVENIETSAWREELARAVLKIANDEAKREEIFGFSIDEKESIPPLSQISNLRSAIGKLKLDGTNKNVVTDWLKHLRDTPNRSKKWANGFGKLDCVFAGNKQDFIWEILEEKDANDNPYFTKPVFITDLKQKLWTEAVKSLFDACARANKRETEGKG